MPRSANKREATFFANAAAFREWLQTNHGKHTELWVGLHKKESNLSSITWPESVDEALCFGWIDGLRQRIDAVSYRIRFTPRKATSTWSAINIKRMAVLMKDGRVHDAGKKAFAARKVKRSRIYSYENADVALPVEYESRLRKHKVAAKYFDAQAPSYRKAARRWIMSAKQAATRQSRLATLIESSAAKQFIPPFKWSLHARTKLAPPKKRPRRH